MIKIIVISVSLFFILNMYILKFSLTDTRDELFRFKLNIVEEKLNILKKNIGRYPTTEEGLMFLCKNITNVKYWEGPYFIDRCQHYISNKLIYKNINNTMIIYHMGINGIDEYSFGDDIRNLPYSLNKRKKEGLIFILSNSIFLSFILGLMTILLFQKIKETKVEK